MKDTQNNTEEKIQERSEQDVNWETVEEAAEPLTSPVQPGGG